MRRIRTTHLHLLSRSRHETSLSTWSSLKTAGFVGRLATWNVQASSNCRRPPIPQLSKFKALIAAVQVCLMYKTILDGVCEPLSDTWLVYGLMCEHVWLSEPLFNIVLFVWHILALLHAQGPGPSKPGGLWNIWQRFQKGNARGM